MPGVHGARLDYIVDLEISAAQPRAAARSSRAARDHRQPAGRPTSSRVSRSRTRSRPSSGATTIQFKKAVLALKVTPQITPDNRIILDLKVTKDSVGQVVVASGGVNVPSIDTREITTQVLVNDGQTVVLGGILETERRQRSARSRTSATSRDSGSSSPRPRPTTRTNC